MTPNAPPSSDPADDDSLAGLLRSVFRKLSEQTDCVLPAVVTAFDRTKNRVQVVPAINVITTDNRQIQRAQIASIPVMQFGGGGLVLLFPLQPGDTGWIVAADRDISNFLQSYKASPPNTLRIHSFQDAVFIPDAMRGWTLGGGDAARVVLQTLDGVTKLALGSGHVSMTSGPASVTTTPAGTTIVGGLTVDGIVFGGHKHPVTGVGVPTGVPQN